MHQNFRHVREVRNRTMGPRRGLLPLLEVQHGFTLIELLVACALLLIVLSTVAFLFAGTSSSRLDVERSGRLRYPVV